MDKCRLSYSLELSYVKRLPLWFWIVRFKVFWACLFLSSLTQRLIWTTSATNIDEYTIPLVEHEAYESNSGLEIVSAKALLKGLKQGKYTWCGYVYAM